MESQPPPIPTQGGVTPPTRPGCVTAYAVLLFVVAGLLALGAVLSVVFGVFGLSDESYGALFLPLAVVYIVIAGLYFLLGRGLWRLKNWARIIIIVLQSLGLLGSLSQICRALSGSSFAFGTGTDLPVAIIIIGTVLGSALGGYILYWFASNGEYFRR
jgi:hypothetical protein